jgi:hypothetical protein
VAKNDTIPVPSSAMPNRHDAGPRDRQHEVARQSPPIQRCHFRRRHPFPPGLGHAERPPREIIAAYPFNGKEQCIAREHFTPEGALG